ncbi:MAG: hypothetical protein KIT69_08490 [Propionibacteriaceae bacterium]|nr:hypothetical protein [Propionibacteriaceae bacterium]
MNDLERAFRDALHRADTVEIPVSPIDPAEFAGAGRGRLPWQGILAAAAALVVVAGVGVGFMLNARGIPAVPAPGDPTEPIGATVEAELPADGRKLVVELPVSVTDELYAMLDQVAESAPHTDPRLPVEGFGGFVVTPVDENRTGFRVQPDAVRFGPIHDYRTFTDTEQVFWRFVLEAIRGSLPDEVLKEISEAGQVPETVGTTVMVSIFSGRENPVVDLDPDVADELYAVLADRAGSLKEVDPPEFRLGIPAFVVTPEQADRPVLWIMPDAVYVVDADDRHQQLLDPDRVFYRTVFDAIRDSLPDDVVKAIGELEVPPTDPVEPGIPSDGPEQVGDLGTWVLLDPDQVTSASTAIRIGVTRLDCSSGVTGEVLEPVVEYTDSHVIIRADVAVIDHNLPQTCQGNDEVPVVVKLSESIGDRPLVDAACLAGEAATTSFCAEGPVRWRP